MEQKTAWFLLGRLREACGQPDPANPDQTMGGIVEVDETYIGGKESAKHADKRTHVRGGTGGKQPVVGLREQCTGNVHMHLIESPTRQALHEAIHDNAAPGARVVTDEHQGYKELEGYEHSTVNHSRGIYRNAAGDTTNGIEGVWAVLKRALHGTWHSVSPEHLHRYLAEEEYRLNDATPDVPTIARLQSLARRCFQTSLLYTDFVGGTEEGVVTPRRPRPERPPPEPTPEQIYNNLNIFDIAAD